MYHWLHCKHRRMRQGGRGHKWVVGNQNECKTCFQSNQNRAFNYGKPFLEILELGQKSGHDLHLRERKLGPENLVVGLLIFWGVPWTSARKLGNLFLPLNERPSCTPMTANIVNLRVSWVENFHIKCVVRSKRLPKTMNTLGTSFSYCHRDPLRGRAGMRRS